jgi:predicted ATPase/DNA-binding SARP family transcriptional activator
MFAMPRIVVLGAFEVEGAPLNTPILQHLIGYLVVHGGRVLQRRNVAFALYPESGETAALANLRNLIYRARSIWPLFDDVVQMDSRSLLWRADAPVELDLQRFRSACAARDYTAAVAAYGGALLPGVCAEWAEMERASTRRQYLDALRALIDENVAQDDGGQADVLIDRLLREEPDDEYAYGQLFALNARRGDRAAIVAAFKRCEANLREHLGVTPSVSTQAAYSAALAAAGARSRPSVAVAAVPRLRNAPSYAGEFVGREPLLAELGRLLDLTRALTLRGLGGAGKTRLMIEVMRRAAPMFEDGAQFISLAEARDSADIAPIVAHALGLSPAPTREAAVQRVLAHLRERNILLGFDNFEHVLDGGVFVGQILTTCPMVRCLITSRERLCISWESVIDIGGFDDPSDAHALFEQTRRRARDPRATAPRPDAAIIDRIFASVDGLPLAIELVAAQMQERSPEALLALLSQDALALGSPFRDHPARHQSLRAPLTWLWNTLNAHERAACVALSPCRGVTREAIACALLGGDAQQMLDRLLALQVIARAGDGDGQTNAIRMHSLVRAQITDATADSDALTVASAAHADVMAVLARHSARDLLSDRRIDAVIALDADLDNVHAALDWLLTKDAPRALRMIIDLSHYWQLRGLIVMFRPLLEAGLRRCEIPGALRGEAVYQLGVMCLYAGHYKDATRHFQQAREEWPMDGQREGLTAPLANLIVAAFFAGDFAAAIEYGAQLRQDWRPGDPARPLGVALMHLGYAYSLSDRLAQARESIDAALECFRLNGLELDFKAAHGGLGDISYAQVDLAAAIRAYTVALAYAQSVGAVPLLAQCLEGIGCVAARATETTAALDAAALFAAADARRAQTGAARSRVGPPVDQVVEQLRHGLGTAFDDAWQNGLTLTDAQACARAFEVVEALASSHWLEPMAHGAAS